MNKAIALLVIDMQVALVEDAYQKETVLERVKSLIDKARAAGKPVIYVQHESDAYPPLNHGAPTWQIHTALTPAHGETIIFKRASDSFYQTSLQKELDARGIRHLVMTGMQTEQCVDTTARQAMSLGYDVTLAADGHTTFDNVLPAAKIIEHHNVTLADLANPDRAIMVKPAEAIEF